MPKYTTKELEMIKDILEGNGEQYHVQPYKQETKEKYNGWEDPEWRAYWGVDYPFEDDDEPEA